MLNCTIFLLPFLQHTFLALPYPETVLLRLRDSKGRPSIKLQATDLGGGIGFGGEDDPTYATLSATGTSTSLKLRNKDGQEKIIKP